MKKLLITLPLILLLANNSFAFLGFGKTDDEKAESILKDFIKNNNKTFNWLNNKTQSNMLFNQNFGSIINNFLEIYKTAFDEMVDPKKGENARTPDTFIEILNVYGTTAKDQVRAIIQARPDEMEIINKEYKVTNLLNWFNDFIFTQTQYINLKKKQIMDGKKDIKSVCISKISYPAENKPKNPDICDYTFQKLS